MKKEATAVCKRIPLLLLFSALIFTNACRKTVDISPYPKENISMDEIIQWGDKINNSFAKPVNMRYDKAQKTFYNNRFYIRVPVDSSTGYFYFLKTQKGLQPLFIRYHSSGNSEEGWAEFIDFDTRKFYKALTYKNYLPEKQYTLTNAPLFFDFFFTPAQATTRKAPGQLTNAQRTGAANGNPGTANFDINNTLESAPLDPLDPKGCPIADPAAILPLLDFYNSGVNTGGYVTVTNAITDLEMFYPNTSSGPGTGCKKPKRDNESVSGDGSSFWGWVSGIVGDIGDFFGGIFGGSASNGSTGDNTGADNSANNPYPNIILDNNSNPTNNNTNNTTQPAPTNGNTIGYGVNAPISPIWQPVDPNLSTSLFDENGFYKQNVAFLNFVLQLNPFALMPCDSIELLKVLPLDNINSFGTMYQRIGSFTAPQSILDRIKELNKDADHNPLTDYPTLFGMQLLTTGVSAIVNCDFYPVRITRLPDGFTPSDFVEYYRTHIDNFIDKSLSISFSPYVYQGVDETNKFYSPYENSVGAIVHIKMPNNGTVVETNYNRDFTPGNQRHSMIFSTMSSPLDDYHPVAGNREFGIYNDPAKAGEYVFYTMGVDRVSDQKFNGLGLLTNTVFNGGDELWTNMQKNMIQYINQHGGQASYYAPSKITSRPNWNTVNDYLHKRITFAELKKRLGC